MDAALGLAQRGLGRVWPNPSVGCVLVAGGRVVGRGWTQPGGRPHGETEALRRAGEAARGATAYVSLEPCNHWGKTPPCTEALIGAGVSRAVVALEDPDPRVSGGGLARLRACGIDVVTGVGASVAAETNAGFFLRIREGRPLVALKTATTLDGRIATASGESRWITGEAARARAHALRATYDAVLVGSETAVVDDPDLTCRLPGLEDRSPVRVVLDSGLRIPLTARVVRTATDVPTWIVCRADADPARAAALESAGVRLVRVAEVGAGGRPDLAAALGALGALGLTRVLVEGGGIIGAALLSAGLVDRLYWFRAAMVIGGDGRPVSGPLGLGSLAAAPRFRRLAVETVGDDALETFARQG